MTRDYTPGTGEGVQPAPMNAPQAIQLGIGVQPGSPNIIRAQLVIIQGTSGGLFLYSGTAGAGNPPILWAVPPGVTKDPYGNTVTAVFGVGSPTGANTLIDASGDIALTGVGGSQLTLMPSSNTPFALTAAFTGIMQSLISLGSGDSHQVQSGLISGITLGTGNAAKMGLLLTSPYGSTSGMGIILQAENDGSTDTASMLVGTVATQSGVLTFTPSMAVYPTALVLYAGGATINVVTHTSGSGNIPIPANAAATGYAEVWAIGGSGGGAGGLAIYGGGGAGGGSYGAEPALAITAGGNVAYVVGGAGASSTMTGTAVTVTGNAGTNGGTGATGAPGAGGAASGNTVAFAGGTGGQGALGGGGAGGGSSAGPNGAGAVGQNGRAHAGGTGGSGGTGTGKGGAGSGPNDGSGFPAIAPGGGGGGSGVGGTGIGGAAGGAQVKLTYTAGTFSVLSSISFTAFTDQFGNSIPVGMRVTEPDGETYRTERAIFVTSADSATINSTTAVALSGITAKGVSAVQYHVRGMIIVKQGAAGPGNQGIEFAGPAVSAMNVTWQAVEAATIFSSGVITALGSDMSTGLIPINTTGTVHFDGTITFSAAGSTFGLTVRCITAAADTWVAGQGSYLALEPV